MIDLLQQILGFVSQMFQVILNIFESLVLALAFVSNSIGFMAGITVVLNPFLSACIFATLAIATIKLLMCR